MKRKKAAEATFSQSLIKAKDDLAITLRAIQVIDLQQQRGVPPARWGDDDPDIAAGHANITTAAEAIGRAQSTIWLLGRLIREEQERRWRSLPPISGDELERRIAEQQKTFPHIEQFCRHCGKGYVMMPGNTVAEDGSVIGRNTGNCRCGHTAFVYQHNPAAHGSDYVPPMQSEVEPPAEPITPQPVAEMTQPSLWDV